MTTEQIIPEERPIETLGSRLQRARTGQGKSLQEAAQVTCINPTTLAALEADNFTRMPAEVFTRGFIKLYAQYLCLDPDEAIKLYLTQENLNPVRKIEEPFRLDILKGAAMARPLSLFKANPRLRIIAILLTALLSFYVLGAILKAVQNRPGQETPENELARSLMESNTPPLPSPAVELPLPSQRPGQTELPGITPLPINPPETKPGTGAATATPTPSGAALAPSAGQPFQSTAQTGQSVPASAPETAAPRDLFQPRIPVPSSAGR